MVLASVLVFLASACSNSFAGTVVSEDEPRISVEVKGYASSSRTIAPDAFTSEDMSSMYFKVNGEDPNGLEYKLTSIEIDTEGKGKIQSIPNSIWTLVLHAYTDSACTKEVLRGFAIADTRNSSAEVTFTLSAFPLYDESTGTLDLTLLFDNSASSSAAAFSTLSQVVVAIADSAHNATLSSQTVSSAEDLAKWVGDGYAYPALTLSSGYYYLNLTFYTGTGSSLTNIGTYSELISIEPNRETKATVTVPDVLYKIPNAPENLVAYRDDSTLSSSVPDSYNVVIRWDDASTNEDYFELTVNEYTGTTLSKTTVIDNTNHKKLSFADDGIAWAGYGSVYYGSTEYVLKVHTGVMYDISIKAVNALGSSSSVSRIVSYDIENDADYGALTGFAAPSSTSRINTFAVSYYLSGGTFLKDAANTYCSGQTCIEYYVYDGTAVTLLVPAEINSDSKLNGTTISSSNQTAWPVLYLSTPKQYWTSWKYGDSSITTLPASNYTNYYVTAAYNITETLLPSLSDGVTATYGDSAVASYPNTGSDVAGLTLGTGKYITLAVNLSAVSSETGFANSSFTSFDFYVNEQKQDSVYATSKTSIGGTDYVLYTMQFTLKGSYELKVFGNYGLGSFQSGVFSFVVQ